MVTFATSSTTPNTSSAMSPHVANDVIHVADDVDDVANDVDHVVDDVE
jgi:hypothetical protein